MRLCRKSVFLLSILCILLLGMCFDSVDPDSFLAFSSSYDQESPFALPTLQHRSLPTEQAYAPKALCYGETVLAPAQTLRRNFSRPGRSLALVALLTSFLSLQPDFFHEIDAYMDFHQIHSNIVIISYIHRQDGKKA